MELTLFILVGAIAVVTAAMMLISENAVHSALFLILNFACIAFFFLMLHAPFLAMVQITVYAGAIMVLFLFVIMLLGAERVMPEPEPRFPWLIPAAVILAVIFLIATSLAIVRGDIELTRPRETTSHLRVINALDDGVEVDVFLNDRQIARRLGPGKSTDMQSWPTGRYEGLAVYEAGTNNLLYAHDQPVDVRSDSALVLTLIGSTQDVRLVPAPQDVSDIEEKDSLRIMAINALHDQSAIDVVDVTHNKVLIQNVGYGEASESAVLPAGEDYTLAVTPSGSRSYLLSRRDLVLEADTSLLWLVTDRRRPDNSWEMQVIAFDTQTAPSFGSPSDVGRLLFSRYVLPFEMVALVLLVAMIGTIVLTHETLGRRQRRIVRRLANPPAGLERPIVAQPAAQPVGESSSSD